MKDKVIDRILANRLVTPAQCWEYTRATNNTGYGFIRQGSKVGTVHRYFYQWAVGPLIAGEVLCHTCDNPRCFNPAHLFVGSMKDNSQDAVSKGRMGKLSQEAVQGIKHGIANGETGATLATRYGVSQALVSLIKNGKRH